MVEQSALLAKYVEWYWNIENYITAFSVGQTLVFLYALKEDALIRKLRPRRRVIAWTMVATNTVTGAFVAGAHHGERLALGNTGHPVAAVSSLAFLGRLAIILLMMGLSVVVLFLATMEAPPK